MYKPYARPVISASPDVKTAPPKISKLAVFILSILVKPYLLTLTGPAKVIAHNKEILFDVFSRALSLKSRCLIAFRHPDGREPQLLTWFFLYRLKALAAKEKIKFDKRPHAVFVYGYEVVRWGGWITRLVMPKLGAIPIHHTKMDSKGMAKIYSAIIEGPYPLALAPEGQVSYSTDTVPRLESGLIRIGFQAASQLSQKAAAGEINDCPLEILPLSIHFRYGKRGKSSMYKLLSKLEKFCCTGKAHNSTGKLPFEDRLKFCRDHILEINEKRYNLNYDKALSFETRLLNVINAALGAAEQMLGIKSEGDFFSRLYRIRHDCWDRIFIPGVENLNVFSRIKRSVMDLQAGEAWHIARHQELADFGWYFRRPLPLQDSQLHEKVEYVQNLWDFANRTMGGALTGRISINPKKIIIKAAPVIDLSARLPLYKQDRKGTVSAAASDLEKAFLDCIGQVNKDEPD